MCSPPVGVQGGRGLVVGLGPLGLLGAVDEHRLAHQLGHHLTLHAGDGADEQVVGLVVGRRARVARLGLLVLHPVADRERVVDDRPAAARHPGRLEHERARHVAAADRMALSVRPETKAARTAIEQHAEHRRRVEARHAHPLDRPVGRHQRPGVAVRQERVLGDGGEGRAARAPVGQGERVVGTVGHARKHDRSGGRGGAGGAAQPPPYTTTMSVITARVKPAPSTKSPSSRWPYRRIPCHTSPITYRIAPPASA